MTIKLPIKLTRKEKWVLASCPALDVFAQGSSEEDAKKNIMEAMNLFLTSCLERGTLEAVLKECGFVPGEPVPMSPEAGEDHVDIPLHLLSQFSSFDTCHA